MSDDVKLCLNGCFKLKPRNEFGRHPRSPDGLAARCRACESDRLALRKHGMTKAEKTARATESGGCAICKRPDPGGKGWMVDHDRSCCPGDVSCPKCRRGILCAWCNNTLGYSFDNPAILRAAAAYLESGDRL